jgi:phage terminase small subunit
LALTKEALGRELVPAATSNLLNYLRINEDGDPEIDFRLATREQMSAIESIQVDYTEGRGENARPVKRIKFQLHEKAPAAMGIARLFGLIVDAPKYRCTDGHTGPERLLTTPLGSSPAWSE